MGLTIIAANGVLLIALGVIPAIYKAIAESAKQTQILLAAIADKPKPPARDEKPADLPWALWRHDENHTGEWKEEEARVERAKLYQTLARQNLEKAKQKNWGRTTAVAECQAALDVLVEKENQRLEERKAEGLAKGEKIRAKWKACPYQLWGQHRWGNRDWQINGGWHSLAEAVEAMEYFTRWDGMAFTREIKEIRSNSGTVLYRYHPEGEAKKLAQAKWPVE